MTRPRLLAPLWTNFALALIAAAAAAQDIDPQATIAALAQPEQSAIDFTEIRFSPMLKEALVISGVLSYAGPQALDRQVLAPYRETTQIRADSVTVSREGERERRFALRRAPELQGLLRAFAALLAGSYAALDKDFAIVASGTAQQWQLALTPRDTRLSERISELRIDGRDDQTQCFWLLNDDAGFTVMLLGPFAHTELPSPLTRAWLQTTCAA